VRRGRAEFEQTLPRLRVARLESQCFGQMRARLILSPKLREQTSQIVLRLGILSVRGVIRSADPARRRCFFPACCLAVRFINPWKAAAEEESAPEAGGGASEMQSRYNPAHSERWRGNQSRTLPENIWSGS
jgi:hypothetical protein